MLRNRNSSNLLAAVVSAFLLGACAPAQTGGAAADPGAVARQAQQGVATTSVAVPLRCEERQADEATQRYEPRRATVLRVYNYRLIIPPGALDSVATFTLHAPQVPRSEVVIQPHGAFDGFNPRAPITLSLGFQHCDRPDPGRRLMIRRFRVVDGPEAGMDLEAEVDARARTIQIRRDDLSGYTIVQI